MAESKKESQRNIERSISDMLHVVRGNIGDKPQLDRCELESGEVVKIDTIVNAAKPTLMGSDREQSVDYAIHKAIDTILAENAGKKKPKTFKEKIRKELDGKTSGKNERIRCHRGQAVLTKAYGLCDYVIHVVGSVFDAETGKTPRFLGKWMKKHNICSSSRVRTLESCYREIVRIIREHPDIKNVAVPIVGSGEYGFPFKMAVKTAIAGIGNALSEWQQDDREFFNNTSEGLQNIIFFVWDSETSRLDKKYKAASAVLDKYKEVYQKKAQVVTQNSLQSQLQYIAEIIKYDRKRGYFCIARMTRIILSILRLFSVYTYLKDAAGGRNWQRRRFWVEMTVALKIGMAVLFGYLLVHCSQAAAGAPGGLLRFILCYNLADTITYLISLILMADIQKPSANVIRSMLLLLLNYVEVSIETACLYLLHYGTGKMSFLQALQPGLMGELPEGLKLCSLGDYLLYYGNTAVKFFFITMAFGYLAGHLRQRTFRRQNVA